MPDNQGSRILRWLGNTQDLVTQSAISRLPSYRYKSLDYFDIRILSLLPGKGTISCYLDRVTFAAQPVYFALSYAWGSPELSHEIEIDGRRMAITSNLFSALTRLRFEKKKKVTLWVDALCIDQSNVAEKNKQVEMMATIYARARGVMAWLGESGPSTEEAFQVIDIFESTGMTQVQQKLFYSRVTLNDVLGDSRSDGRWSAVMTLLQSQWFQRIWVLQEIAMAERAVVLCGPHRLRWETFALFFQWLIECAVSSAQVSNSSSVELMSHIRKLVLESHIHKLTLFDLLAATRHLDATIPHDKIFSLLGLGDFMTTDGIVVDYNQSCERLYTNFAASVINRGDLFKVLSVAGITEGSSLYLMSWVPDWSLGSRISPGLAISDFTDWFKAGGATGHENAQLVNWELLVDGIVFDTIIRISHVSYEAFPRFPSPQSKITDTSWAKYSFILEAQSFPDTSVPYPTSQSYDHLWPQFLACCQWLDPGMKDLAREKVNDDFRDQGYEELMYHFEHMDELHGEEPEEDVLQRVAITKDIAITYQSVLNLVLDGRKCCSTFRGYLGWVPGSALEGDIVCVLKGAKTPHILRSVGNGTWALVGECYIHGVMEGEALTAGDFSWGSFTIT